MQLSFDKDEQGNISVKFVDQDRYKEFSYAEMIKRIYDDKRIEDAKIVGTFSEKEIQSITDLIDRCREVIVEEGDQGVAVQKEVDDLDDLLNSL